MHAFGHASTSFGVTTRSRSARADAVSHARKERVRQRSGLFIRERIQRSRARPYDAPPPRRETRRLKPVVDLPVIPPTILDIDQI